MKKKKGTALFLVICMVASLFTGIPVNAAEEISGLAAKTWIDWDDQGTPSLNAEAGFETETWGDLYGATMYLAYLENGEERTVTAEEIEITTSDGTDAGDKVSVQANERNTEFLDFSFTEVGDYKITYTGEGTSNKEVTLQVTYPEVGFYTSNEPSFDNLIKNEQFQYASGEDNTFYMIFYRMAYSKLDLDNIVYTKNDEPIQDITQYFTITPPENAENLSDKPGDYLEEEYYVYKVEPTDTLVQSHENFWLNVQVPKTDVWDTTPEDASELSYSFADEPYSIGRGIGINEKMTGLFVQDWIEWDENDVPNVHPDAEWQKETWAELGIILHFGYAETEGAETTEVPFDDLSVQYNGQAASEDQVKFYTEESNNKLVGFEFSEVGDYTVTYQNSLITIHVVYPSIGFYETEEVTVDGSVKGVKEYEGTVEKTFYIIPREDFAEFPYKVEIEAPDTDGNPDVKINGKALDSDEEITGIATVTIAEDAKLDFGLKVTAHIEDSDEPYDYANSIWCHDILKDVPARIKIKTVPNKTTYIAGEKFDKTGMVVEAEYEDEEGNIYDIREIQSYTVTDEALTKEDKKVTITYEPYDAEEPLTVEQGITVKEITGIQIKTPPKKTSYKAGEKFDKTGMVVEVLYSDESKDVITDYTVPDVALKETDKEITVTYKNFTAKQPIKVKKATSIQIKTPAKKTTYTAGEKFDKTGMVVELVYSDGSKETITDYTVPNVALKETDKEITVTYKTFTAKQAITVKAASIAPAPGDTKTVNGSNYKVTSVAGDKKAVTYVSGDKNATKVTVPSVITIDGTQYKVTAIADKAFSGCSKLKTVSISSNVTTIGKKAFSGCKKLTKVTIGKNVKTVGKEAFSGCGKLKTLSMGANVTTIGDKAFYKCTALTKVTIPAKVSKIGKQTFFGCKKLKTITIKTTKLTSKKVGSKAFKGIHAKATIKVPKKKLAAYKKILKAKGVGSKAKIKK